MQKNPAENAIQILNIEFKRVEKWAVMIEEWDYYMDKNRNIIKKRVRKGIPDLVRGTVWQLLSDSVKLTLLQEEYESLLKVKESEFDSVIIRDITRTFPKHPIFRERAGPGQKSLFNVLKAFAIKNKEIGYCQGMGFISGLFLSYLDEQSSFWLLEAVVQKHELAGFFKSTMPSLGPSFYKLFVLMKRYLPKLFDHFLNQRVQPSMYASQWFLTIFSVNFSFEILAKIWDIYLLEGIKTVYRFGLAVLRIKEKEFLEADFEGVMDKIKTMYGEIDSETLLKTAFSIKITNKILQTISKEFEENPNQEIKEFLML